MLAAPATALAAPAAVTTPSNQLLLVDGDHPETILGRHAITGLMPAESIRGIDVRPATGQLYGLGIVNDGASDTGRIYTIDPGTGVATEVGSAPFSTTLTPSEYGFDFNPFSDRIRIVNSAEQNMRVNADTGELLATDNDLNPAGDVDAIAYDQNVAGTPQTTLWGYDSVLDKLVRIGDVDGTGSNSANNGQVTVFANPSGISTTGLAGMDIGPGGAASLVAETAGPAYSLYAVDLGAGTVTPIGQFPEAVEDLAWLPVSAFVLDDRAVTAAEAAGSATVTVLRLDNSAATQEVNYSASDGDAGAADYFPSAGTLIFRPGETSKTFSVGIKDDTADEPNEVIDVSLADPSPGASLGNPSAGTITILDDDAPALPADKVKPTLLLSVPSALSARKLRSGVAGAFSCSEACRGALVLKLGSHTLGKANGTLTKAGARHFRVRLSSRGKKTVRAKLARRRSVRLLLTLTARDVAGNVARTRDRVSVSR